MGSMFSPRSRRYKVEDSVSPEELTKVTKIMVLAAHDERAQAASIFEKEG